MVVDSIGSGGAFATIALWVSDGARAPGDIGELKNEVFDEHVTIDVDNLTLRAESGAEHDGTFGSGARVIPSDTGVTFTVTSGTFTVEDIELQTGPVAGDKVFSTAANVTTRRCLLRKHVSQTGSTSDAFFATATVTWTVDNCVFYDFTGTDYNANGETVTLVERNSVHFSERAFANTATMSNTGSWTFEGCLLAASGTEGNLKQTTGTDLNVTDCIFDHAESPEFFDTDINNTFSATFQWGSGGSGTRVMFDGSEPDFHLLDHVDNEAKDYIPAARAPYVSDDFEGDVRPSGASDANSAGPDEPLVIVVGTSGEWDSAVSFVAGDDLRITIDGPAVNQAKISVTLELE